MKNRLVTIQTINITGWILYTVLLYIFFSSLLPEEKAVFKTVELVSFQAAVFYFNSLFLMPRLLEKKRYSYYIPAISVLIIIFAALLYYIDFHLKPFGDISLKGRGPGEMLNHETDLLIKPSSIHWRPVLRNMLSFFAIVLVSIIARIFYQKSVEEKKEADLKNEILVSEMRFLKSQVNPHFLFNALNNIYTLVLLKHDNAPDMLIKLSDMLRYMLYECNDDHVAIGKEITYINNYIELQKLKTEQPQNIITNFRVDNKNAMIPPLLLIPFVENSFKHSRIDDVENGWIKMMINSSKKQIYFKIENSIPATPVSKDRTKGIGLENVKRRLELMYPDKHYLKINSDNNVFNVELTILMHRSHKSGSL